MIKGTGLQRAIVDQSLKITRSAAKISDSSSGQIIIPPWVSPRTRTSGAASLNLSLVRLTISQLSSGETVFPVLPVVQSELSKRLPGLSYQAREYRNSGVRSLFLCFPGLAEHSSDYSRLFNQDAFTTHIKSEFQTVGVMYGGAYSRIRTRGLVDVVVSGAGTREHYALHSYGKPSGQTKWRYYILELRSYFDAAFSRSLLTEVPQFRCPCLTAKKS